MHAKWIILRDYINASSGSLPQFNPQTNTVRGLKSHSFKDVRIWGPKHAEAPIGLKGETFIIADDDGNVYYWGVADKDAEFQPLDMYGAPNDGATMIAYAKGGKIGYEGMREWHVL